MNWERHRTLSVAKSPPTILQASFDNPSGILHASPLVILSNRFALRIICFSELCIKSFPTKDGVSATKEEWKFVHLEENNFAQEWKQFAYVKGAAIISALERSKDKPLDLMVEHLPVCFLQPILDNVLMTIRKNLFGYVLKEPQLELSCLIRQKFYSRSKAWNAVAEDNFRRKSSSSLWSSKPCGPGRTENEIKNFRNVHMGPRKCKRTITFGHVASYRLAVLFKA